jgi:hypothetical protein
MMNESAWMLASDLLSTYARSMYALFPHGSTMGVTAAFGVILGKQEGTFEFQGVSVMGLLRYREQ